MKKTALLFGALLWFTTIKAQEIRLNGDTLRLENDLISKIFLLPTGENQTIRVISFKEKLENKEFLREQTAVPYFEFFINNSLITAQTPVWQFLRHNTRTMPNGGKEICFRLAAKSGKAKGLKIEICQQILAKSPVVREQLRLLNPKGKKLKMNKKDGKIHFVFPAYSFRAAENAEVATTEINLANWNREVIDFSQSASYDERTEYTDYRRGANLGQNHIYHPRQTISFLHKNQSLSTKAPVQFWSSINGLSALMLYEHASQDGKEFTDYLNVVQNRQKEQVNTAVKALHGAYFEGEEISPDKPYNSVWAAFGVFSDRFEISRQNLKTQTLVSGNLHGELFQPIEHAKAVFRDYVQFSICEDTLSRKPCFYYNTWGMQRREAQQKGIHPREVISEKRILEEIEYAAGLGVDLFVLDDGWQKKYGEWQPDPEKLPNGLAPIRKALAEKGMTFGIWISAQGIDSTSAFFEQHPECLVRENGKWAKGQANQPVGNIASPYYDFFVESCKALIDSGVRFFKWDAINSFDNQSLLPGYTGDQSNPTERNHRYGYELPRLYARAMAELKAYQPGVVIEIDLTEERRRFVGLAPLSQGKFFFMNNGASAYHDYSHYRAKASRRIVQQWQGFLPMSVFTYANYPHNEFPYSAQRYNANSSLIAGRGFWGNLAEMTERQRSQIAKRLAKAKRVLPYIEFQEPEIRGDLGASPEIYTTLNKEKNAGQIIAFSAMARKYNYRIEANLPEILGVLNHAFESSGTRLALLFEFPMPDATREAFILPAKNSGVRMTSSTAWIDRLWLENGRLHYIPGADGEQVLLWDSSKGTPKVSPAATKTEINRMNEYFEIKITSRGGQEIVIGD